MDPGVLNRQITIQQYTVTRDSYGGEVQAWADLVTVWAQKAHRASREFFAAQKVNAETTDMFIVRFRSGVTAKMRVTFDGKTYDIIGADDPDGRKRELQLLCRAVE